MSAQTSIFLPDNLFDINALYAASWVGSSGDVTTLALQCTATATPVSSAAAATTVSPACDLQAPASTITVGSTTFEMTTVSKAEQSLYTFTETCLLAPAVSTAVCNVSEPNGPYIAATYTASRYAANVLPVDITKGPAEATGQSGSHTTAFAGGTTSSSGSRPSASGKGKTSLSGSGPTASAKGKTLFGVLVLGMVSIAAFG